MFKLELEEDKSIPLQENIGIIEHNRIEIKSSSIVNLSNFDIKKDYSSTKLEQTPEQINNQNKESILKPKTLYSKIIANKKDYSNHFDLNKDIKTLIDYKAKKRELITITNCERFKYIYCCGENKTKLIKNTPNRELLVAAEDIIKKKSEVIDLWKSLDQFRLLTKIILNESQCFMIQNRNLQCINNTKIKSKIISITEEKFNKYTETNSIPQ